MVLIFSIAWLQMNSRVFTQNRLIQYFVLEPILPSRLDGAGRSDGSQNLNSLRHRKDSMA